jgi:glycosyltransferase involved in cell wall biosynthesis
MHAARPKPPASSGSPAPAVARIAFLSKSDATGGGASRVACQLRELMARNRSRFEVDHWVALRDPQAPLAGLYGKYIGWALHRIMRKLSRLLGLPDFLSTAPLTLPRLRRRGYGLVHVHDISDAVSPYALQTLAQRAPMVWTFHDCSPFTGGCIYPLDCTAYQSTGCGDCPQLGRWPLVTRIDRTSYMQAYKVALINEKLDAVICPSEWIARQARAAGVDGSRISVIPNAVDSGTFRPDDKLKLREELGLPRDAPILLLAAMDFKSPYKGWAYARETLTRLKRPLHVLLVGANLRVIDHPGQHTYLTMERTFDRRRLAKYYACSDLLLFPSMADNCPLVLLESMACGTPAVAFDSGGIGEIIDHQSDGWLARRGNAEELVNGIDAAMDDEQLRFAWSCKAREKVLKRYDETSFLEAHLSLYESLLSRTP